MWKAAPEASRVLKKMAEKLVQVSTIHPGQRVKAGKNKTGRTLLTPGCNSLERAVYPAYWVRDPAWLAEDGGLVSPTEVWGWITLMSETMRGASPWFLASGGVVLPFSLADHILLDGSPVYYPGTYASDERQGPPWGKYPPHDDQYWMTFSAYAYARMTGDWHSFLREVPTPEGMVPLWQVCEWTHNAFFVDEESQLCVASEDLAEHIVDWGYNDTVTKTGKLLFPSLLRLESASKLEILFRKVGISQKAERYHTQAEAIRQAIFPTFYREERPGEGWLLSATGLGHKADVWGTAFAIYRGCLGQDEVQALGRALLRGFRERTTVLKGQVRHLPTSEGFWEVCSCQEGTYQNGAYWGYPVGWYLYALSLLDTQAAEEMFAEYLGYLQETWDEQLEHSVWECINPEIGHYQNPGYLTTVALPYAALKAKGMLAI